MEMLYSRWRSIKIRSQLHERPLEPRWLNFGCFSKDVGLPPTSEHRLYLTDEEKGYTKDNLKWMTPREAFLQKIKDDNDVCKDATPE